MRIITLEEHFTAQEIINENNKFNEVIGFYKSMVFVGNSLTDIDDERIKFMDEHRIDMQVLSYTSPVEEKSFFLIFAKAAELDVSVSFHPAPINPVIQDYYYASPEYSDFIAGQFASAGFGWHLDVRGP